MVIAATRSRSRSRSGAKPPRGRDMEMDASSATPIRAVLVDDHAMVREGVRSTLIGGGIQVVGEAEDGVATMELVRRHAPDLLVLDLGIPGLHGLEVLRRVRRRHPRVRVVVLTMLADEDTAARAVAAGADGYVLKSDPGTELLDAIRAVAAGARWLTPSIGASALEAAADRLIVSQDDPFETLTVRETEVLQGIAEGRTSREIAHDLRISPRTVENHRAKVMQKLGLRNQREVVRYALRRRLVALDPD